MELKEYHYVYYSYEEWGMGYFGSRTCKCLPEEDVKYFGSFSNKKFKPTQKIILKSDYASREEAYADEITLQEYYKVVENPHFANRAYQTSKKFSWKSNKHSKLTKQKISLSLKGKKRSAIFIEKCKGRKHSEETKRKMSESRKGIKNHNYGKQASDFTRKKLSEVHKGKTAWNKGKSVSEEVKEKIRQKNKGRKQTEEHKLKKAESLSKHFTLQSPCGKIISGKNISRFCEDNNLNKSHIFSVLFGKRKHHKGWTTPINNDF
jgi:hypothetical protein